jgi:hypothetical protein
MNFEKYWYEAAPFVYTVAGGVFLGRADSVWSIISSLLLLSAGGTIIYLRRTHSLQSRNQRITHPAGRARHSERFGRSATADRKAPG